MKVGIDISSIVYDRGVSRYTSNLVRALLAHTDIQLSLYGSSLRQRQQLEDKVKLLLQSANPGSKPKLALQSYPPSVLTVLWSLLKRNSIATILPGIDVFHSWDWLQPPDKKIPLVSTIHDLAILKFPETAHPKILKMHQRAWKTLRQRQADIIAVSHATKRDIVELLDFPSERVHVIYEALPHEVIATHESMTEVEADAIKQRLKLDKPYILFVGTREPRKNLKRLMQAWEPLAKEVDLLIAGESGWDESETWKTKAQSAVRFLGKVTDKELAVLYGEAELFAYPSLYEGFGLPILEAYYHGTPVVTSAVASLPEVAGNAAELVDPESVESIRQGLTTILEESQTAEQKRLQQMIIRLQLFDWRRTADETIKVYRQAIGAHV